MDFTDLPADVTPPEAPVRPMVHHDEGNQQRHDDYHWLENRGSDEVQQWLEQENHFTEQGMAGTAGLQASLFAEMKARLKEDDQSLPYQWHGYEFFIRTFTGKNYPVHYRRKLVDGSAPASEPALEQILFDGNSHSQGHDYFDLGVMAVSPDNRLLGWAEDFEGNEVWTLRFRDLDSGTMLPDVVEGCAANIIWAADNRSFWYIRLDQSFRPWQLCHHHLGMPVADDKVLFEEQDERFFLSAYPDRVETRLIVETASTDTTECYLGSLEQPEQPLQLIRPRKTGLEYYPDSDGETLFIRTNDRGINYRLVTASFEDPGQWQELLPHRPEVTLEDYEIFPGQLVLFEREAGLVQVRIRSRDGQVNTLEFPDQAWSVGGCDNAEYRAGFLRLEYESLNRPPSVMDVDLTTGEMTLRRQMPVLGGFDPELYETRRLMATSHDGVQVPVSVVGRKESFKKPAPALLYGYGAYGSSEDPYFSRGRLNLLDRGMLFAIAHVRGGADLGETWYRQGRRMEKKNSFHDFIACAEHLIAEGLTDSDRLVISGGSAGGLLMGAVLNIKPELFAGAVLDVPFVDVLNTMMNPELPLTITEYDEWGDPAEAEVYDYIRSYSPCDNVSAREYPAQLVLAGLEDRRVQYWEPAKWVARVRALKTDNNPVFLKTHMGAGHFGASGRYDAMKEAAFEQAFILSAVSSFLNPAET